MKKYEFTEESISTPSIKGKGGGIPLKRIRALVDIPKYNVRKGDLGGFIGDEINLSHGGDCWVGDNAMVWGNVKVWWNGYVFQNAIVFSSSKNRDNRVDIFSNAWVYGNVVIYGDRVNVSDAHIFGNAIIHDYVQIGGNSFIYGNANIFGFSYNYKVIIGSSCDISGECIISGGVRITQTVLGDNVRLNGDNIKIKDCHLNGDLNINDSINIDNIYFGGDHILRGDGRISDMNTLVDNLTYPIFNEPIISTPMVEEYLNNPFNGYGELPMIVKTHIDGVYLLFVEEKYGYYDQWYKKVESVDYLGYGENYKVSLKFGYTYYVSESVRGVEGHYAVEVLAKETAHSRYTNYNPKKYKGQPDYVSPYKIVTKQLEDAVALI